MYIMVCGCGANWAVTTVRNYKEKSTELLYEMKDAMSCCRNILMIDDASNEVVYDFNREKDARITRINDINIQPIRKMTQKDLAIVSKAWKKSMANYNLDMLKA